MRDTGLEQAIAAAGGVGALARLLNIAQPSVSSWKQVPPERVLNIEALTGVSRSNLRPDLYPTEIDELELMRAEHYRLIAVLLGKAPTEQVFTLLRGLQGDAAPLGLTYVALSSAANEITVEKAGREFFNLFIGLGRGDFLPYASYYLTGFLHEKPLANVRADMMKIGIERADQMFEPEDHIALLCEMMAGMIDGTYQATEQEQQDFLKKHVISWALRFLTELEMGENATFYRSVGRFSRVFLEIENEALSLS